MLLAPEDELENAQQELDLVRFERQHEVRSIVFRAMQQMSMCERIILIYQFERDGNDRVDAHDIAWWLGCPIGQIRQAQAALETKLRGLLSHLADDVI